MEIVIRFNAEEKYIDNAELNQVNSVLKYLEDHIPSEKLDEVVEELESIKLSIITTEMHKLLRSDVNDALARKYYDKLADQYDANNHYIDPVEEKLKLRKIVNDAKKEEYICGDQAIVLHKCINSGQYTTKEQVKTAIYTQWDNDDHL